MKIHSSEQHRSNSWALVVEIKLSVRDGTKHRDIFRFLEKTLSERKMIFSWRLICLKVCSNTTFRCTNNHIIRFINNQEIGTQCMVYILVQISKKRYFFRFEEFFFNHKTFLHLFDGEFRWAAIFWTYLHYFLGLYVTYSIFH